MHLFLFLFPSHVLPPSLRIVLKERRQAYAGTKANSIPWLFTAPKWSLRSVARECCLRIEANVAGAHNVVSELQRTGV